MSGCRDGMPAPQRERQRLCAVGVCVYLMANTGTREWKWNICVRGVNEQKEFLTPQTWPESYVQLCIQ